MPYNKITTIINLRHIIYSLILKILDNFKLYVNYQDV